MIEYSKHIAEKWNIPTEVADFICNAFDNGDSPYYLNEYAIELTSEVSSSLLWEIYDYLEYLKNLITKKKRTLNAYIKAGMLTPDLEKRIHFTTNNFELDDLLLPVRPNARSRGQMAINKGLNSLAGTVFSQNEEIKSVEELAQEHLDRDSSVGNVNSVIQGIKDIIAEQIAYDETVRAMTREFAFEEGFFEVIPKNKKDQKFSSYINKSVLINEISNEELLFLFNAETKKQIRLKLGVQLFRITELLRHHVLINPDATGFDLICEAIDDCWVRLLQPIIERDIKSRFREQAQQWALRKISNDFEKIFLDEIACGPVLVLDSGNKKYYQFLAIRSTGELLGTTTERKHFDSSKQIPSERLKQFINRYKTEKILVVNSDNELIEEQYIHKLYEENENKPDIVRYNSDINSSKSSICAWVDKEFDTLLDNSMKKTYTEAIKYLHPLSLLPKVGLKIYSIHHLQDVLHEEYVMEVLDRIQTAARLQIGIPIKEINDSQISKVTPISDKLIQSIKNAENEGRITAKNDLLNLSGMTETIFRNIAGFIIIPNAENLLDRTVVHPDHFILVTDIAESLNVSIETIVTDPDYLQSYTTDTISRKIFIDNQLCNHISAAKRFIMHPVNKNRRKLKLAEVKEGAIVSGRVTNITQFGVFVNINAVCDGLIHISQLADEYVETPEQVVSVNDRVDVRILKVDIKKRRISLSMRNLGTMAPKVRPSKGQLDNLAEFFKNR